MADIIPFDHKGTIAEMPAHLVATFGGDGEANIGPRVTINQLSYRGKIFRRVVDGEEIAITKLDADTQERVPMQIVNLVVLDHNKGRSRAFYEGEYEEGKNASPKCFSGDGIKPDAAVSEPCAATCATCPNNVKGSKITPQGKAVTACAPYKRIAVVPSASIGTHVPLLLRLAQTSVWDKENAQEANGWYAWDQYLDMLRARGAKHTAAVETRVKFDADAAYPKLLFSASRWLNPEEAAAVKVKLEADKEPITGILNGRQSEDGTTGQPATNGAAATPTPAGASVDPAAEAAKAAAAAQAAETARKAAEAAAAAQAADKAATEAAAEKARKKAAALAALAALEAEDAAPAVTTKAAAPADDGFGGGATPAPSPSPAAAATGGGAAVIESGTPANLKGLLDNWDA